MRVQEAVAVYGVETVSIKDLLACIIGDEREYTTKMKYLKCRTEL